MQDRSFWLTVVVVGVVAALLMSVTKWAQYSYLLRDWSVEFYLLISGAPLLLAGLLFGRWLGRSRRERQPKPANSPLSQREFEVLAEVARGHSNQEVADQLHVSLNTVKTHLQSIYGKLDVKRRTQAIEKARHLGLLKQDHSIG
ncbi:MAG: helix-turn-helix transcriptional regulator [Lysobacteraceae bacterium]|nr:MAG: helix-turn-helix transcriptional regulator [Xanthomonadaceae bacterium]